MKDYQHLDFKDPVFNYNTYYDIESVQNVFSVSLFTPSLDRAEIFLSTTDELKFIFEDPNKLFKYIKDVNPELKNTKCFLYDLDTLAGLSVFLLRFQYSTDYDLFQRYSYHNGHLKFDFNMARQKATRFHEIANGNPQNDYQLNIAQLSPINDLIIDALVNSHTKQNQSKDEVQHQLFEEHRLTFSHTKKQTSVDNLSWNTNLGFNARNYDLTMISAMLSMITPDALKGAVTYLQYLSQGKSINPNDFKDVLYLSSNIKNIHEPLATKMIEINNILFNKYQNHMQSYLWKENRKANNLYQNLHNSNRFIDIMDSSSQVASLKAMASMLGRTVKESDFLGTTENVSGFDQLADLLAYNFCDVLNTAAVHATKDCQILMNYQNKKQLLSMFPICVYQEDSQIPTDKTLTTVQKQKFISKVDHRRLILDDTAAKYATRVIAPYQKLNDFDGIDFTFPRALKDEKDIQHAIAYTKDYQQRFKQITKQQLNQYILNDEQHADDKLIVYNVTQSQGTNKPYGYDVLNDTLLWYIEQEKKYPNSHLTDAFRPIYRFLNYLRNQNVNDTKQANGQHHSIYDNLSKITKEYASDLTYFYRDEHGNKINSLVKIRLGGIHGAEYNKDLYELDILINQHHDEIKELINQQIKTLITDGTLENKKDALVKNVELSLKPFYDKPVKASMILNKAGNLTPKKKKISLFDSSDKLRKRYKFVSNNTEDHLLVVHVDFSSYYPTLLTLLGVYQEKHIDQNGNPYIIDRYADMYYRRLKIKACAKNGVDFDGNPLTPEKKAEYTRNANGNKLILNSASGQSDGRTENNIRMNNAAYSMRLIGELFALRIGQAFALHGCRVPSTNTDGLYVYLDPNDHDPNHLHNRDEVQALVDETIKDMFISVDAEALYQFISKDTNNRIEYEHKDDTKPSDARGGDLRAYDENHLDKKTTVPPVLNQVLSQYLHQVKSMYDPFDKNIARIMLKQIIQQARDLDQKEQTTFNRRQLLTRLSWTVRGNKLRINYLNELKPVYEFNYLKGNSGQNLLSNAAQKELNTFERVYDQDGHPKIIPLRRVTRLLLTKYPTDGSNFTTLNMIETASAKQLKKMTPDKLKENLSTSDESFILRQCLLNERIFNETQAQLLDENKFLRTKKYTGMPSVSFTKRRELPNGITNKIKYITEDDLDRVTTPLISSQPVKVVNQNFNEYSSKEINRLLDSLDIDAYLEILNSSYENNWRN